MLDKLTENGYQIPDDLSIVGTDDSSLSHLGNKKLTTLTHPKEKLGQDAARWIVTTIEKGQAQPNILYEPVLVERETVKVERKEPKEINEEPINKTASVVSNAEGMEELAQTLQHSLITGVTITAKNLDERMVALGFITKKTGFGGVVDMLSELMETGKINYQLRRKPQNRTIIAEIIGEQNSQSQLMDKIIIKKIFLHEL